VHWFLNLQRRPLSCPSPRLRFKPGQVVWISGSPGDWVRVTVLETNTQMQEDGRATNVAAYWVKIITKRQGGEDLGSLAESYPIAHDSDFFIRILTSLSARSARPRRRRRDLPLRTRVWPRSAARRTTGARRWSARESVRMSGSARRALEVKRRKEEEEERRRLSSVHAAQAAARAATREPGSAAPAPRAPRAAPRRRTALLFMRYACHRWSRDPRPWRAASWAGPPWRVRASGCRRLFIWWVCVGRCCALLRCVAG
jgi:hypothetical protein